eukprot:TRINITY_DN3547_c0_g1_i1.p2 TRINITY_DN3547_c0_g1~~TRINITY_DN3547_c0_g1_i1.p2  ORF type:complete len:131 (-),score=37.19 TRINITY_DN3547_c0_g1_i1:67-459(-)
MHELKQQSLSSILGDGLQTRDMIFVGDVVDAIIAAMEYRPPLKGEAFNICTGSRITVLELNRVIARTMGLDEVNVNHRYLPFADGNVVHSQGDPSKARQVFGWESKIGLEEGVKRTWEWFQENPNFYERK